MRAPVTFLLLAVVFVGSFCHAQDQTVREEQNRVAVAQIQAGAPVFDPRSVVTSIQSRYFRVMRGKNDSWYCWVGAKYGIELVMSYKMLIFKAGIDFSSLQTAAKLFACWKYVLINISLSHTQCIYDNDNSKIFNSFIWNRCLQGSIPQRNWFLTRNYSEESMPWVLKSLKFRALNHITKIPVKLRNIFFV